MYESIPLEKSGLIEAGVPPNSTSIARAEVLQADSHSSPPSLKKGLKEAILSERPINLNRKETLLVFSKGRKKRQRGKKVLRKHTGSLATLGYFLGHLKKKKKTVMEKNNYFLKLKKKYLIFLSNLYRS